MVTRGCSPSAGGEVSAERAVSALGHFDVAAYRFLVEAAATFVPPRYLGSTLRGGLGRALRAKVCLTGLAECGACPLRAHCLYPSAFETELTLASGTAIRGDIPRPLILIPGPAKPVLEPGERFAFGLTLIGTAAIRALPYFVHAVERFGELGIGKQGAPFRLLDVHWLPPRRAPVEIWSDGRFTGAAADAPSTSGAEIAASWTIGGVCRATLRFLTPTRFKASGRFVADAPPFSVLIGRLLDRLEGLSVIQHATPLALDFREWRRRAEDVEIVEADVHWHDWTRYSSRQRTAMQLGGLLGSVTYAGDLSPFLPLLGLGEWLHVGKNATFGLGRYAVELAGQEDQTVSAASGRA